MTNRVDAFAAIRNPLVRTLMLARVSTAMGMQILNVAVGWQLYERTASAWSLGLIGLFEILPVPFLMVVAGNAADRFPRRNIAIVFQSLLGLASFGLMALAEFDGPVAAIYVMLVLVGTARVFSAPAISTFLPQLIKSEQFANANSWVSSAYQLASISGPALGGLIIAWSGSAAWAFFAAGVAQLVFVFAIWRLPVIPPAAKAAQRLSDLFAGFTFIKRTPVFLAAITLDMLAVLLGGAVVLLPIFAKDVLHVGADGLGWLRAAPSMGSLVMALTIAHLKPWQRPGRVLLWTVVGFGLATVGFGFSRHFAFSFLCLVLAGAFDAVSVVIRLTLEQVVTPDYLRGRVSAINYVFVGFSNELGAFESGATAALFGPVASVVGGGIGTIVIVIAVVFLWPALAKIGPLHTLKASEDIAAEEQARHAV